MAYEHLLGQRVRVNENSTLYGHTGLVLDFMGSSQNNPDPVFDVELDNDGGDRWVEHISASELNLEK